jgi:Carboxypeptidase regulatory-like domain/TonB-dependent Receptor Plug Domain
MTVRQLLISVCLLVVCWTDDGWCQTLVGTVRDETGAALPGATVTAVPVTGGPALSTLSDASGSFRLELLAERNYEVRAALVGFAEGRTQTSTSSEGETRLDLTLAVTSFAEEVRVAAGLGEVPTVGSRLGLTRQRTPASVDVITQDVLQARGADTASTALRGVTGVTSSLCPGASAVFSTRGFVGGPRR